MSESNMSLSTESTAVARIFAAMRLAEVSTVRQAGDNNATMADAYAESFTIIFNAIGVAMRAKQ